MRRFQFVALAAILPLSTVALLPACKSETYESGAATGKTVQQAADEIDHVARALEATMVSLKDLVEKPAPEPSAQFKAFAKNVDALETQAKGVSNLAAQMEKNSKSYFAQWDQQIATIANEDIRERSQERREKIEKALAKVREQYTEARDEFKPLLADIKDVRTALAADLTADGIAGVKKSAAKVADGAADVKETLAELSEKFRELGIGLGKAATPPPPPPAQ